MHIIHTRPFLAIWCCQVLEIHISFFSTGLPSYIKEMFALNVVFSKLFGVQCFSLLWAYSFYRGSVFCPFCSSSNNSKCLMSNVQKSFLQLKQIDTSIPWLPLPFTQPMPAFSCQEKTFWESVFPMLFTFILDWFSFPDLLFLCLHSVTLI